MGWWSTDIMGGDSPLDIEDAIFDICNVEKFPDDGKEGEVTKEHFTNHMKEILEFVDKHESYDDDFAIAHQVLGIMMMKCGAEIDQELKERIICASGKDSWAKEDEERRNSVNIFEKALKEYTGVPVEITSKGLFEVIADHLNKGNTGLVNRGKGI